MRKPFFFFLISFIHLFASGNNDSITSEIEDSLLNLIIYENDYEVKINHYLNLIQNLQSTSLDKALKYSNIASNIAENNHRKNEEILILIEKSKCYVLMGNIDKASETLFQIEQKLKINPNENLLGKYYHLKGYTFSYTGEFAKAMDNALKAIPKFIKTKDSLALARTYNLVGVIYDITGNNQKALESYLQSKDLAEKLNNLKLLGDLNNNIGIIYDILDDNDKALIYYYKSLEYYNKTNNNKGVANAFNNIATILFELGRLDESLIYNKKSLKLSLEIKDVTNNANIYENMSGVFLEKGIIDSAYYYLNKSLQLNKKIKDEYGLAFTYEAYAQFYLKTKNHEKAIEYFKKVIQYSSKIGIPALTESSILSLSEIYAYLGNYKLAYDYQLQVLEISDSVREENRKEEIKLSELQLEFRNQTNKYKSELEKYEAVHKKELQQQIKEKYLFIILSIIIITIAIILYLSFKKLHKINDKLTQQNREIEDQKELIEISNIELKEQYTFTETLLNTLPNPVFYTDKNSVLLGCNNAFEEIIGRTVDEIIGINLAEINLRTDLSCDTVKLFGNPGKSLVRNEGSMGFHDGKDHDVICYRKGIVNTSDKLLGILGIIIDITDIRRAEKDLTFSQTQLKEAINAKDKFFSIMAHDLKNPFNAILGLTGLMSDDYDSHSEAEKKQYITLINQSATQIYNLLENLLEWARAQSGTIDKSPMIFPINEIVQECINLFNQSIEQKSIKLLFNVNKEFMVFADKNMIMTVIRNLLSNAIKYSPLNGQIDISILKLSNDVKVEIKDNGLGIDSKNLNKLFKIDKPVSTPGALNEKGTGLGLIICQEFVKLNNGKIGVKSRLNQGTTFFFTLPSIIEN